MQVLQYCTAAWLVASVAAPALAQQPVVAIPAPGESSFTVFVRGVDVGREQVNVTRSGTDWLITSTGKIADQTLNRFELKYTADWQPVELRLEATQAAKEGQKSMRLLTSFAVTSAINEITQDGATSSKTDQITARSIVLPNNAFAGYEALAARLASAPIGTEVAAYIPPRGELKVVVKTVTNEDVKTPAGIVRTRRLELLVNNPGGAFSMTLSVDDRNRLAKLDVPGSALAVIRNDLAGVAARALTARNPTDSDVTLPANGFSIAGTLTAPPVMGRLKHPTVILVGGSGPNDRDGIVAGIPILSQLAGSLAQQGFLVLRYDRRGIGQSGGRTESATQRDYAEDLIAVIRWLARRDDVDNRRLAVVGYEDGGAIALQAAAREKKIGSLVLIATGGTSGAELVLEQQRSELDRLQLPEAERSAKIELQKQIQAAVIEGTGWEALPPEVRRQADTPAFRSQLLFDPAEVMPRVKQPLLIIHGERDAEVPPHHATKLGDLARARKKDAGPAEVVQVPGVNHLLVPAPTGGVQEYPTLADRTVSPEIAAAIVRWLKAS
jgi:pimeloyl-ACP methyl ester carboxylesterase